MSENSGYALSITEEESLVLEAIAQSVVPYSQRAQALLAVDAGSTVEQAAGVAGLSPAQVRYWITRFRNTRLQAFPEELLGDIRSLVRERAGQGQALKKTVKTAAEEKGRNKKETAGSAKKDGKKPKSGRKKKDAKDKALKKTKAKKEAKAKKKAQGKKEAQGKKDKSAKTRKDKKKKRGGKKKGKSKNA